jgi:hypothetical protein
MRNLARPEVLKSAAVAALATALLCYPRLAMWEQRTFPIWYLEAMVLLGTMVLWGFVFAWQVRYGGGPVFVFKLPANLWAQAAGAALLSAAALRLWLDPGLRSITPEAYPTSFDQWLATMFFHLAFVQLFLVFAPMAWLLRLTGNRMVAATATVLFGVGVLAAKVHSSPLPVSLGLWLPWLAATAGLQVLSLFFYLRGGVILVWWFGLVIESRLLPYLHHSQ